MDSALLHKSLPSRGVCSASFAACCSQRYGSTSPSNARFLCSAKTSSARHKAAVKSRDVNGHQPISVQNQTHEASTLEDFPASTLQPTAGSSDAESASSQPRRKIRIGWHREQGKREEMEDDIVVQENAFGEFVYAAVFDGHVGKAAVNFLKKELYDECMEHLEGGKLLDAENLGDASLALEKAFVKTDERLLHWLEEHSQEPDAGSTATAVFARHGRLFVAHLGDSRAVMAQNGGDAEELSEDHRPHGESSMALAEKQRIQEAGGWVSSGRVCGMLAVSRAFGNRKLKNKRDQWLFDGIKKGQWTTRFVNKRKTEEAWLSAVPHVFSSELGEDAEFVLIASDGLWDAVRSSEAVRFVHRQIEKHNDVQKACEELVAFALKERKSDDNVSLVCISFI